MTNMMMTKQISATSDALWQEQRLERIHQWRTTCSFERFIDNQAIAESLDRGRDPDQKHIEDIIQKARANATTGAMLSQDDVAALVNVEDPQLWESVFETADWIKRTVYGDRIVLFAPLYVASQCVNDCVYCGFRSTNSEVQKRTLTIPEIEDEITALVNVGHKRLIMVYGEHPSSDYEYICRTVETAYQVKQGLGEIRRANVNAAPLFEDEYRAVHATGIGTYQVFQETYHRPTYEKVHPRGTIKGEYDWRLFSLHEAQKAGIDDVGLGVLFGLYDCRFELLGLLNHAMALERDFGVGPHTISYPRIEPAQGTPFASRAKWSVPDKIFRQIVATIRLMCPYTGSILTAREQPTLRRQLIRQGGVSQMDAGSRIAVGGYRQMQHEHLPDRQQFILGDTRSLDAFIQDLCKDGLLPSFCTAGYREGRTGANFMPLAKHATVKNFCIANGILTFQEYLSDYASAETRHIGQVKTIPIFFDWVKRNVADLAPRVQAHLACMQQTTKRDLHF